jgi:hypothetical protein
MSCILLSMKVGSLFDLFVLMRSTESGCFRLCSWSLWKALKRGASALFHVELLEYWMISSLKSKLRIIAENFGGIGMCL